MSFRKKVQPCPICQGLAAGILEQRALPYGTYTRLDSKKCETCGGKGHVDPPQHLVRTNRKKTKVLTLRSLGKLAHGHDSWPQRG